MRQGASLRAVGSWLVAGGWLMVAVGGPRRRLAEIVGGLGPLSCRNHLHRQPRFLASGGEARVPGRARLWLCSNRSWQNLPNTLKAACRSWRLISQAWSLRSPWTYVRENRPSGGHRARCENLRPMVEPQDIRWLQRFENFQRALQTLERAVQLSRQRELTELEQQGLIQGFEFTHELAWNVLKDYLREKGFSDVIGSRDATRLAFQNGLIADGDIWMDMIRARNQSSHTYNLELAQSIAADIISRFFPAFLTMRSRFLALSLQKP